ncbi:GNAT family N-acetyltransferase, partial [Methylobacterium sp. A52T]
MSAPLRSPVVDGLPAPTIRTATLADLDALVALEHAAFATDRAERRAIRHAIRSPSMDVLAALIDPPDRDPVPVLVGAAVLERRRGSRIARLASIAV